MYEIEQVRWVEIHVDNLFLLRTFLLKATLAGDYFAVIVDAK